MENNELTHHGIKGMKWGVRRYQNKDGTLTTAGKKRYDKELAKVKEEERILKNKQAVKAKLDKLEARRKAVEEGKRELDGSSKPEKTKPAKTKSEPQKKSIKDMSDEEIRARVDRIKLENSLRELMPEKVSAGRKFWDAVSPTLGEVAKTIGKDYATKKGKEWLGLDDKSTKSDADVRSEKLKKAAEDAKNEWTILDSKNKIKEAKNKGKDK